MPIRPENKDRYPKNWKSEIRPAILKRAENERGVPCCEQCGTPNGMWIEHTAEGWTPTLPDLDGAVKIVLTIAHLDHTPENCDSANLRAWCQRCHNAYDAPMRRKGIVERARAARALGDLFK